MGRRNTRGKRASARSFLNPTDRARPVGALSLELQRPEDEAEVDAAVLEVALAGARVLQGVAVGEGERQGLVTAARRAKGRC